MKVPDSKSRKGSISSRTGTKNQLKNDLKRQTIKLSSRTGTKNQLKNDLRRQTKSLVESAFSVSFLGVQRSQTAVFQCHRHTLCGTIGAQESRMGHPVTISAVYVKSTAVATWFSHHIAKSQVPGSLYCNLVLLAKLLLLLLFSH